MKLFEIQDIVNKLKIPNFRGIFLRNQLPNVPNEIECGIIHSHTIDENIESIGHWSAYYKNNDNGQSPNEVKRYWFCSYGGDVYDEVKKYLGLPIMSHTFSIQQFSETCCAEYCIIFLALMSKGLKYEDVVLLLVKD